ncbi:MAG: disulfide bond formation protein B [Paucibacter sp.]|nr:disulfide bond formation protein B [Roseateles sp.]
MFFKPSKFPARALAAIACLSFAAVAVALIAQHQFGVKACPWCVMQRGIFLLMGALSLLGLVLQGLPRKGALLLVTVLALCGVAAAVYQNQVAAQSLSCAMTLADRINTALGLEDLLPSVFMVTANCSEAAAYRLLGLPYEVWSGLLYLLLAGVALMAIRKR